MENKQYKADFWDIAAAVIFLVCAVGAGVISGCKDGAVALKQKIKNCMTRQR